MSARQDTAIAPPGKLARYFSSTVARSLADNGTLIMVLAAFAVVMLIALRHGLVVDGWLALVSGREVAQHGFPSHDTLTVWAQGRRWVDQQWLAQLVLYELTRMAGLKLALLFHAALGVGALAAAATLARRLGGSARSATWVCLPVLVAYYPEAAVMRPQSFAYPLFVAVFWLLVADAYKPSRRVFLAFPLVALWANLHGSALLGAALIALAGAVGTAEALLAHPRRISARSLFLLLGAWPCLLASPYVLHLPGYYEKILVTGNFGRFVTEWAPTTLTLSTAPVYLLVIAGMWLLGRAGKRVSMFEKIAFLATAILAFQAVRNTAWLGLTALIVLPRLVDAVRRPAVEPQRLNRLLATAVLAGVAVAVAGIAAKPQAWFQSGFPARAARIAASDAGAQGEVFAMSPYADWLLWSQPELRGRVAFDARFELFTSQQFSMLGDFLGRVGDWSKAIDSAGVIVLGRRDDRQIRVALVQDGIARVAYADRDLVVLVRAK